MNVHLVIRLRDGVVERQKRWQGDTHDDLGGWVDYDATDSLMKEAADMLEALAAERDALAARLADVEAERDNLFRKAALAEEWRDHDKARAEAAEAENAKMRDALTGIKRAGNARMSSYGDEHGYYYFTAVAALEGEKP